MSRTGQPGVHGHLHPRPFRTTVERRCSVLGTREERPGWRCAVCGGEWAQGEGQYHTRGCLAAEMAREGRGGSDADGGGAR